MNKLLGSHNYYVYILTNKSKKVLYIGVTNDLKQRLYSHINNQTNSFTSKYKCFYLIYFEHFQDISQAIAREKQLKGWRREKKIELIELFNPNWNFLNDNI
ncbi:GIY-YIG nuclease family protein [Flavobacterium sp. xlx-214]|nr:MULTISPECIES: GIY-YIG nuclease family protein [unclassified Flavobacterium]MBA5793585.1 GIY-YIG nuclease family protein [Flavobacterium sp. xlx-221]QMI84515.1 GIY-YIG nuclease family protein [Flavobacterium sp. xlx-214]